MTQLAALKAKPSQGVLRSQITKIVTEVNDALKDRSNFDELKLSSLQEKGERYAERLQKFNEDIGVLLENGDLGKEYEKVLEYEDKLIDALSRLKSALKLITRHAVGAS